MAAKIRIEIDSKMMRALVLEHLRANLGALARIQDEDVRIEVKSKQNYRSEWEGADFRAVYETK